MKKTFLLKTMLLLCALMVGGIAWADPVTTATATDGNSYVVAYHANNKYYALPHGTSASVWNATEVTLNGINKVSTSDAANLAWTLTEGTTAGQFYLTYTSGSNTYYLYKNGGTSNSNYNIKGTTTESERHYWEFALNTEGNYYTVQSLKSGTGSTIYLGYTNVGKYGVYTEDKAAQIILLEIGDASTYTASFSVNGVIDPDDNDVVEEGSAITFPSAPSAIAGKNFIGWKKGSAITGVTDEAPEVLTSDNMGNADVTYYAVFANDQPSNGWQKIEDLSTITEGGIYALITPDDYAFNGTMSSGHGQKTTDAFSFNNNIASSAPTGTCEITLTAVTGGYKMYNESNGYLYASKAGSGGLAWHNSEEAYWSYTSDNWRYSVSYSDSYANLRCYNNTFRTYSGNNGVLIAFAKKITLHNYSNYCTTIIPEIIPSTYSVNATTAATNATINVTYNNITTVAADVAFCESDGTIPANSTTYNHNWITAQINSSNNLAYTISANTGAARTAYLKVWAYDDDFNEVYSDMITITQAAAAATATVTVSDAGLATFASNYDLDYSNVSGLEAYIATIPQGATSISLTKKNKIPAGTGVLLRATDGGNKSYTVPLAASTDTENVTGNLFVRGTGAAVASDESGAGTGPYNYILNNVNNQIGFYKANGQTVATNRAYLHTTIAAESRIAIDIDPSGINVISRETTTDNRYFDLQGRRVAQPQKGLYIVNGKKVIIK